MSNVLFFDVETVPDRSRSELFLPDILRKLYEEAPADHADPDIINAQAEMRMSLTPEFCRIVGLNLAVDEGESKSGWVGDTTDGGETITEQILLQTFWRLAEQADRVVGFNILRFDLNVILVRSAILGVFPTVPFFASKPWEDRVIDLAAKRVQFGRFEKNQWHSLKALRRLYGLSIPEELADVAAMDGGSVNELYEQWQNAMTRANDEGEGGDPTAADAHLIEADTALQTLKKYGKLDVHTTRELCRFWGGYYFGMIMPRQQTNGKTNA